MRSSAIAAAKHCRKAKTALRVVAADSPELRRVDTHSRTTALVLLFSDTEPKWGRTCFCIVVSSRAHVVGRRSNRVGNPVLGPFRKTELRSRARLQFQPSCAQRRPIWSWSRCGACPWRRGSEPCSERPFGFVQTRRAVEGDGAQCGPRYLWRRSACVSSHASTAARRYRT